jgi:hypothetical protein
MLVPVLALDQLVLIVVATDLVAQTALLLPPSELLLDQGQSPHQ